MQLLALTRCSLIHVRKLVCSNFDRTNTIIQAKISQEQDAPKKQRKLNYDIAWQIGVIPNQLHSRKIKHFSIPALKKFLKLMNAHNSYPIITRWVILNFHSSSANLTAISQFIQIPGGQDNIGFCMSLWNKQYLCSNFLGFNGSTSKSSINGQMEG